MEHAGTDLEDEEERDVIKGTGIGTPATRAGIIEVLIHRQYVRRDKKNIVPTEKGQTTYEIVKDMRISDVGLTAGWEVALNNIENGVLQPNTFRQEVEIYTVQVTSIYYKETWPIALGISGVIGILGLVPAWILRG